jgi:hypothetical protein
MRLKILAISDTHLGNSVSLLSSSRGSRHLRETLRRWLLPHDEAQIEELILVGDILERAWAPLPKVRTCARDFIETLRDVAAIEKVIYLMGDHDHTLWTAYREKRLGGESDTRGITGPRGDTLVKEGNHRDETGEATELLSIFFGHLSGPLWKEIEQGKGPDFVIANPVYARRVAGRTYAFAHGTHFRKDIVWPRWMKLPADFLTPNGGFGVQRIDPGHDVRHADSMEDLERILASFVDDVRPVYEDNRAASWLRRLHHRRAVLRGKFDKVSSITKESRLFSWEELAQSPQERIRRLATDGQLEHESLRWWQKYFLPHLLEHLEEGGFPQEDLAFVFGDTHDGGWGEMPLDSGGRVRLYNLGGWVLYDAKGHPDCHLFAVDEAGEEYLLDASFGEVEEE